MAKKRRSVLPRAVALTYDAESERAPHVSARGTGILAKKILEVAESRDIPIRQDPDLLELLDAVEVMEEIPSELYDAVAEVLAFIYRVNEQAGEKNSKQGDRDAEGNLHSSDGDDSPTNEVRGDSFEHGKR